MSLDTSFDLQLESLTLLNWLPWVGEKYKQHKVLLVAESHYDDGEEWVKSKDGTREVIKNQGLKSEEYQNRRLLQGIERSLLNNNISTYEQRRILWKNVSFFNLSQRLLPAIEERPSDIDFHEGWVNFLEVLSILKPKVCIKYGHAGIGNLGNLLHNYKTGWLRDDANEFNINPYTINLTKEDYKVRIIFTHHPSMAFNYQTWAKHISTQFEDVETLFIA